MGIEISSILQVMMVLMLIVDVGMMVKVIVGGVIFYMIFIQPSTFSMGREVKSGVVH